MRLVLLLALSCALLAAGPAWGQYDPALRWQTLETPHFRITYHDGEEALAQRTARAAEYAHRKLAPRLGHEPKVRTEVVISDDTDFANGYALAFLYPNFHLYAAPPDPDDELNDYDDYLAEVTFHEYTHVLHMDNVRGAPEAVNQLLGQLLTPNAYQPRWFLEGLAVYEESALTQSGRVRSNYYRMLLRAEYLESQLFRIDQVSHDPTRYPYGATAYLYGSSFVDFMARQAGEEALAGYSADYGSRLLPYALNLSSKRTLGQSFLELYPAWEAELRARLDRELASIRARPVTPFRVLTRLGSGTGSPHFTPDGQWVIYVDGSPDQRQQLRKMHPDGSADERIAYLHGGGEFGVAADGRTLLVSQPETYRQFSTYRDLYLFDALSGASERLTWGMRASEPNVGRAGRRVAFVLNEGAGKTALAVMPAGGGPAQVVYRPAEGDQVYSPNFSPDGRLLVFSEHRGRFRDLYVLDLSSGAVRALTRDQAIDTDPNFTVDGRWILFASDRTGAYDLYAIPTEGGEARVLLHTETGAFDPELSPDGRHLVFVTHSARGFDIGMAEVDLASLPPAPPSREDRGPWEYVEGDALYPSQPYSPWRTLLPHYWLPVVGSDAAGLVVGALTSGSDILGKHSYAAELYYSVAGREPGGSASYVNRTLYPALSASVERELVPLSGGPSGTLERQTAGSVAVSVPIPRMDRSLAFGVELGLRDYQPLYEPTLRPDGPTPFLPAQGVAATLTLSAAYSSALAFTNSISYEEGVQLGGSWQAARRALGGDFEYDAVQAAGVAYQRLPWVLHHVLALRLEGGWSQGDLGGRRIFTLGGPVLTDPVRGLLTGTEGGGSLRGYPPGAFSGNRFVLGTAEYRFPIANLDRGFWTLPFFLRRLHGAAFSDVGEAAQQLTPEGLKPSVGAEARLEFTLGYALTTTLRLGYARGLASGGINDFYLLLGGIY